MKTKEEILQDLEDLKRRGYEVIGEYGRDKNIIYLKKPKDPVAIPFHLEDSGFNDGLNDLLNNEKYRLNNLEEFMTEIKRIVRNLGRTNFVESYQIEELIVRYDRK